MEGTRRSGFVQVVLQDFGCRCLRLVFLPSVCLALSDKCLLGREIRLESEN